MPENSLSITYEPEDPWHGQLLVCAEASGFRGHGSAWFSIDALRAFVLAMDALPIQEGSEPKLEGGYWGNQSVEHVHLGLRIIPVNSTGTLQIQCTFAEPFMGDDRQMAFANSARVGLLTSYGDLQRFRASLNPILDSEPASAVLRVLQSEY